MTLEHLRFQKVRSREIIVSHFHVLSAISKNWSEIIIAYVPTYSTILLEAEVENLTECEFRGRKTARTAHKKEFFRKTDAFSIVLKNSLIQTQGFFFPAWCNITVCLYYKTARKICLNDIINFLDDGTWEAAVGSRRFMTIFLSKVLLRYTVCYKW